MSDARYYYLGPWQQYTDDGGAAYWGAPAGTVGLVDLRPLSPVQTFGFFATAEPLNDSNYEPFGDASGTRLNALTMTPQQRAKWSSMLGINGDNWSGNRLLDVLVDTLTVHADPDGEERAKPLTPLPSGELFHGFVPASADKIFESTDVNRAT